jgi:hypothetical protein
VPAFRCLPLKLAEPSHGQLAHVDVRKDRTDLLEPGTDHFNIEKKAKIHFGLSLTGQRIDDRAARAKYTAGAT